MGGGLDVGGGPSPSEGDLQLPIEFDFAAENWIRLLKW